MPARRTASWLQVLALLGLALPCAGAPSASSGQAPAVEDAPRAFDFERLSDNGRGFITTAASVPLRCLDAPGLLALPAQEQEALLDKAGSAGFNAISFEAPLYGPQGLVKTLGKVDAAQSETLSRLLKSMAMHRLYAFPVLWTPATVDALIGTASAKTAFFSDKNSLGWQSWMTRQLAALPVDGEGLTGSAAVGGWLLYRGPWPGGEPKQGAVLETVTPTTEAWMRNWAQWQVKVFRKAGFTQRLGLGLWAKQDFTAPGEEKLVAPAPNDDAESAPAPLAEGGAPFAPLSTGAEDPAGDSAQAKALDVLPIVPGADKFKGDQEPLNAGEQAAALAPATPWDLEGLDWSRIEDFLASAPLSTQVDFIEFSLETEDWYRVGDRLAEAALKAEVPVVWRQDWRTASRYERGKRLEPPAPLAGLAGPWPEDDWPGDGESIWPPKGHEAVAVPFNLRKVELIKQDGKILLSIELNKPAAVTVHWGKAWPLKKEIRGKGKAKTAYALTLAGAAPDQWLLVQVRAESPKAGAAVARARWMKAPK